MKTRDVVFYSEGAKMAGTIYLPDDYKEGEKRAAVLCNSGWTGVNKCYPALYARALTAYGFVCMGFDYRGFKPSEDVHPCLPKYTTLETEVEDIANAFTFMQVQPEVDPERCGRGRSRVHHRGGPGQGGQGGCDSELLHQRRALDARRHGKRRLR